MVKLNPYEKMILLLFIRKTIKSFNNRLNKLRSPFSSMGEPVGQWERQRQKNESAAFLNSFLFVGVDFNSNLFCNFECLDAKLKFYCQKLFSPKGEDLNFLKEIGFDKYENFQKYEILDKNKNLFFNDLNKNYKEVNFGFELSEMEVKEFSYFMWQLIEKSSINNGHIFNILINLLITMKKFYENNKRMNKFVQVFINDLIMEVDFNNSCYKLMLHSKYHIDFSLIYVSEIKMLRSVFSGIFLKDDPVYKKLRSVELIK